jgi:REP element-mobilizing transposase RayT
MTFHPDLHRRRAMRLRDYDYVGAGGYFVTVCAWRRQCLFGDVVDGGMRLNDVGMVVKNCWNAIPEHFRHVELDEFVIMPNHIHGIFWIKDGDFAVGARHASPWSNAKPRQIGGTISASGMDDGTRARHASPLRGPKKGSVGAIVGSFKSAATKHINTLRVNTDNPVWQRNYHEYVIRGERDLLAVRQYITDNPAKWDLDVNHPDRF